MPNNLISILFKALQDKLDLGLIDLILEFNSYEIMRLIDLLFQKSLNIPEFLKAF